MKRTKKEIELAERLERYLGGAPRNSVVLQFRLRDGTVPPPLVIDTDVTRADTPVRSWKQVMMDAKARAAKVSPPKSSNELKRYLDSQNKDN